MGKMENIELTILNDGDKNYTSYGYYVMSNSLSSEELCNIFHYRLKKIRFHNERYRTSLLLYK
jgi:hypothetical protein